MGLAFRAVGSALAQVFSRVLLMLLGNLSAMVMSLPLLFLATFLSLLAGSLVVLPLWVALLVGVLPNPALAGPQLTARELAHGEPVDWSDQVAGWREYGLTALIAWLFAACITLILVGNFAFYIWASTKADGILRGIAGPLSIL